MLRGNRYFTIPLCVVLVFTGLSAFASGSPQDYTIRTSSDLVILDVGVKGSDGHYISGLATQNFSVLDNGRPRKISYFSNADSPVAVGLVVDNSGSMMSKRSSVITAGLSFAATSNPKDEYFVLNFNDSLQYGLPRTMAFTDSIEQLHHALQWARPIGETRLYDAVTAALDHISASTLPYHVLIVVSDGGDNASKTKFPELLKMAEESRATIYAVGLADPSNKDLRPSVLKKLAKLTGGEYFQPESDNDVAPVFKQISSDVRHRYILGFVPEESPSDKAVRTVKVSATEDGRKLAVRTRTTYIIEPPDSANLTPNRKDSL